MTVNCPHCQGLVALAAAAGVFVCPLCGGEFSYPPAAPPALPGAAGVERAARLVRWPAIGMLASVAIGTASTLWSFLDPYDWQLGALLTAIRLPVLVVVAVGAVQMLRLRGYHLAVTGAILCLIPCLSPDVFLAMPIGVYALVVLLDRKVRGAFEAEAL